MKTILIPMANGAEDIELVSIIDVLRRAKSAGAALEIVCASIHESTQITLDSGLIVQADTTLAQLELDAANIDAIALAGGYGGMSNLKNDARIIALLQRLHAQGKLVAAICASPIVLAAAGVLGAEFTCYPGCEQGLPGRRVDAAVHVAGNVITSAGPITASYFALEIVRQLGFTQQFAALCEGMLIDKFGIKF